MVGFLTWLVCPGLPSRRPKTHIIGQITFDKTEWVTKLTTFYLYVLLAMIAPTYYLCDVHPTTSPMLEKVDSSKKPWTLTGSWSYQTRKKYVTIFRRLRIDLSFIHYKTWLTITLAIFFNTRITVLEVIGKGHSSYLSTYLGTSKPIRPICCMRRDKNITHTSHRHVNGDLSIFLFFAIKYLIQL